VKVIEEEEIYFDVVGEVVEIQRGIISYLSSFFLLSHSWILVGKAEGKRPLGRPRRRWMKSNGGKIKVKCGCVSS
jgi:hypothetical protein